MRPLTLEMALEVAGELCPRHREEILRTWPDVERWAHSRVQMNGVAYGLRTNGRTVVIFGLVFDGAIGTLWLAGREGWARHLKHLLRVWRVVQDDSELLGIHCFRCRVHEDNLPARRMVEHLGFSRGVAVDGLLPYGMVAP